MIFSRETSSNITLDYWLVVSNMIFMTFHSVLGISSSQVTKSYFSEGFKPPTSNISSLMMSYDLDTMRYIDEQIDIELDTFCLTMSTST
jgi:hypothetical protein